MANAVKEAKVVKKPSARQKPQKKALEDQLIVELDIEACSFIYNVEKTSSGLRLTLKNKTKQFIEAEKEKTNKTCEDVVSMFTTFNLHQSAGDKLIEEFEPIKDEKTDIKKIKPEDEDEDEDEDYEPKKKGTSKKRMRTIKTDPDFKEKKIYRKVMVVATGETMMLQNKTELFLLNLANMVILEVRIKDIVMKKATMANILSAVNENIEDKSKHLKRNLRNSESIKFIVNNCEEKNIPFYIEFLNRDGTNIKFNLI